MALLHEAAMLARLEGAVWGARKLDKEVTEDILTSKNADGDAGGFSKALLPGNQALSAIRKVLGKARNEHYKLSAPWGSVGAPPAKGARIITTKIHQEHSKMIEEMKDEFAPLVKKFIGEYDEHKKIAKKKLGQLYKDEDYPDKSELDELFLLDIKYEPVPDPTTVDDWRLTMPADEVAKIKKSVTQGNLSAVKNIQIDLYKRLHEKVEHAAKTLKGKKKGYHATLITNISEVSEIVEKLNISEDMELTIAAKKAKSKLTKHSAEALKADPELANEVAEEATEQAAAIANSMSGLMGDPSQ